MLIHIIHLSLTFLLLWALYKSGCRISCIQKLSFKAMVKASWLGVLAFTLNEGLRFGRGLDYNIYADHFYNRTSEWFYDEYELIFAAIVNFLKNNGCSFQWLVMLMSFMLIVSLVCFLRNFRQAAPWGLPAFALLCSQPENIMRWYFGASFLIIGFSFFFKEEKCKKDTIIFVFFSIISVLIHYGLVIMPIAYYLMTIPKRPLLKPWIAISLFFLIGIFFQTETMLIFTEYLNLFSLLSDRSSDYIDNIEQWLTGGSDILTFKPFPSKPLIIVYCISVWLGYRLVKILDLKKYTILYNIFSVGFVVLPIGNQLEIATRYQQLLFLYQFVIWGYVLKYLRFKSGILIKSKQVSIVVFLVCIGYVSWFSLQKLRTQEYYQLYIWNSNGRKFLDLNKTYYKDLWKVQRKK